MHPRPVSAHLEAQSVHCTPKTCSEDFLRIIKDHVWYKGYSPIAVNIWHVDVNLVRTEGDCDKLGVHLHAELLFLRFGKSDSISIRQYSSGSAKKQLHQTATR